MSITVADLISFEQIRAVLTVSKTDLPDKVMQDFGIQDDLLIDLTSWFPSFADTTDELVAVKLRVYTKLFCAATIARTAPIFVLSRITVDDKTSERSSSESYLYLHEMLLSKAVAMKKQILSDIGSGITSYEELSLVSVNKPYRDVITEARQ